VLNYAAKTIQTNILAAPSVGVAKRQWKNEARSSALRVYCAEVATGIPVEPAVRPPAATRLVLAKLNEEHFTYDDR
jgi:hypothetical protein